MSEPSRSKQGSFSSRSVPKPDYTSHSEARSSSFAGKATRSAGRYVSRAVKVGTWAARSSKNEDGSGAVVASTAAIKVSKNIRRVRVARAKAQSKEKKAQALQKKADYGVDFAAKSTAHLAGGEEEQLSHDIKSYASAKVAKTTNDARKAALARARRSRARKRAARKAARQAAKREAAKAAAQKKVALKSVKIAPFLLPVLLILLILFSVAMLFAAIGGKANLDGMDENEKKVASYLLAKGLDPLHTAAVMGNIHAESGFDPSGIEFSGGGGHGLCQWTGGRYDHLKSYAASKDKEWSDIYVQLDILWAEMTGEGDAAAFTSIQYDHTGFSKTSEIEEATRYFGRNFERPNETLANWDRRIKQAKHYYAILTGNSSGNGNGVVESALSKLGAPYIWGAAGPNTFDCSGLVVWSYEQNGFIGVTRTTYDQIKQCTIVPESSAVPGDLVFMKFSAPGVPEHVGIYMGGNMMVHAPTFGSYVKTDTIGWVYSDYCYGRLNL